MNNRNKSEHLSSPQLVEAGWLWIGCLIIFAVLLLGPSARAQSSAQSTKANPTGNADAGKRVYVAKGCWECHDYEGQGGAGPRIGPPRLSLTALIAYIRQPKGQMPPYVAKVLSDSDAADIYAFLQSVPKPVQVKSTPLLDY